MSRLPMISPSFCCILIIPFSEVQKQTGAEFIPCGTMGLNLREFKNLNYFICSYFKYVNKYMVVLESNSDDITLEEEDIPDAKLQKPAEPNVLLRF